MRIIITILACILVLGTGIGIYYVMDLYKPVVPVVPQEQRVPAVQVQVVVPKSHRIDVASQGTVTPRTEIQLVAQVSGEVVKTSPTLVNGGFFVAGDLLVQLDTRDYQLEVTRTKAEVAQAALRISLELAEAEIARREWQKMGKGEATPLTLRAPQVAEAKARLAAAEAVLAKAELALERTTIRAPFDGRVRHKSVDIGQFVASGSAMARIYAVDYVEIRLPLHDSKLKYLDLPIWFRDGKASDPISRPQVTLTARFAQRTHSWPAEIVRTEGEIDPKSRMVHAIARVTDPYGRRANDDRPPLAVGMFVDAKIRGKTYADVVEVPRDILRAGQQVLIVDRDNRLHRRTVQVLFTSDTNTAILASGVVAGERICLSPITAMFDGMKVRVIEDSSDSKTGRAPTDGQASSSGSNGEHK